MSHGADGKSETLQNLSALSVEEGIVARLLIKWGGQLPSWTEFKDANASGAVMVNSAVATRSLYRASKMGNGPKIFWIIYGLALPAIATLSVPVAIAGWIIFGFAWWWAPLSFVLTWFLYKVILQGACDGVREAAFLSERFYLTLVSQGAFLFGPADRDD